jgi:arsenite methyltransferase
MPTEPDRWSRWILGGRDGNDERQRLAAVEQLAPLRDQVLTGAEPLDAATLLDVGCGDGLIGLAALERVGPSGTVIFSDISSALLAHARATVEAHGALERARFVRTRAEDLAELSDESVDVVTTRSVLIYVADKPAAFAALHRVLRPGGRVSLFEPINRLMFPEPNDRFWGYDVAAVNQLAGRVKHALRDLSDASTASMRDFDDRDLVDLADDAGFAHIHLVLHVDVGPGTLGPVTLGALLDGPPNPLAPTLRDTIRHALNSSEQRRFIAHLEREFHKARPRRRWAGAYLTAQKAP